MLKDEAEVKQPWILANKRPETILAAGEELCLSQLQKLFTTMLLPQSEPCAKPRPQR